MDSTPPTTTSDVPQYPVNSYDNHAVHIAYHNRFRKSQQFEALDDRTKAIFEKHVQLHQLALQQGMTPQDVNSSGAEDAVITQPQQAIQAAGQQHPVGTNIGTDQIGAAMQQGLGG